MTVEETGLKAVEQKFVLIGKEMDDLEHFHMVGVKSNTKVILIENLPTKNEDREYCEEVKENAELLLFWPKLIIINF